MNSPPSEFNPFFGVVAPALRWVPSLRYLLRRKRILEVAARFPKGRLLEIGCGSGALLVDFERLGYDATGLETSVQAIDLARIMTQAGGAPIAICDSFSGFEPASFDLVCSFDVLEHIENDEEALCSWKKYIKEGGRLLISVPAHSSRWNSGDIWAGHYRRYDLEPLSELLGRQGLVVEYAECYGFPLANLTELLGKRGYSRQLKQARNSGADMAEASAASGVDRKRYLRLFKYMDSFPGRSVLRMAYWLQRVFRRTRLGSGYIVLASLR